ncbi:hypothetical protein BDW74DRAFT_174027 [Aspergillus multicolor]|uniref:uncharacterized protein n=1 Tax=Aspergillus multicolor TaxID=41759 RepID=UPI003CCCA2E3
MPIALLGIPNCLAVFIVESTLEMRGGLMFNPATDISDLAGKIFFITGGTADLGAETTLALAKHNASNIYISGRNAQAAQRIIAQVGALTPPSTTRVQFIECDLSSLRAVKKAASQFLATETRLDVLSCNAGIMASSPGLTEDGYEVQFGTNHLGHALLVREFLPLLQETASRNTSADADAGVGSTATPSASGQGQEQGDARIIILTSLGYKFAAMAGREILFDELRTPLDKGFLWSWVRYGQSKLANLLYAMELARRYPSVTSVSVHPGVVSTNLIGGLTFGKRLFANVTSLGQRLTPEGSYNSLWAASTTKGKLVNGRYEPVGKLGSLDARASNEGLARELWEWTQKVLDEF